MYCGQNERKRKSLVYHRQDAARSHFLLVAPQLGSEAMLAVPTPDHYLPMLYVLGTRKASEPVAPSLLGLRPIWVLLQIVRELRDVELEDAIRPAKRLEIEIPNALVRAIKAGNVERVGKILRLFAP